MTKRPWRAGAGSPFVAEKTSAVSSHGMVVANHPLGALAGAEMLATGGNAFDAAIATLFALNVVEPMMVGLFGAGWTNLRLADGSAVIIDNYSVAPRAATPAMYRPLSDNWPEYMEVEGRANTIGPLAVGVPGTLAAWSQILEQYGRFDMSTVMQPAIGYAERGFRASQYLAELTAANQSDLASDPEVARLFLPEGRPLSEGDWVRQPELAESLRTIAQQGASSLYGGVLGQTIADGVQRRGGILTIDDLQTYETVKREPLVGTYRGYTLTLPPPPCSGGLHILQILRILEEFDVAALGFGTVEGYHLLAECFKIAFADRSAHVGDPSGGDVPVEWLLSSAYASQRRTGIDMERAAVMTPGVPPSAESANTTHVTAADADGNIACMTQTINAAFGAKMMVPGTGILLNNTMALFDPHPGHPNSVSSGKRMVSSMSPTIVTREGRPFLALGTPGGVRIFPSILQALVNIIDHGMSLQEAVEAPRIWTQGQQLEVEEAVPESVRQELTALGHPVTVVKTVAGGMNGISFAPATGEMTGAACWRADGTPVALGGGPARRGIRFQSTAYQSPGTGT